ncbi:MAG TPA: polyketide synthase dehydratase domain-containing protein [Smithella sp.]|nr:polyketide synthase dehydratase domain-containing protein [Smithella sp.]NMC97645.1 hypothetical protein [Deltaproteobacteria bacterium]MDM7988380.1 polyketide synthase dehydratase domain-containing protein [Smithella sp.]HNY49862.1 polyketide synthase dehydratase domain-containing protein [Smithella sp.]HOG89674.1 polyketide synthase dehydratase domain-containing protein [Smithella sp.]
MESFPGLNQQKKYSLDIEICPYLRDHHLEGKTILPAVESLIVLARALQAHYPLRQVTYQQNAVFHRFLPIAPDVKNQPVIIKIESSDDADVSVSLWSLLKSKTGQISRELEHARVVFTNTGLPEFHPPPFPVLRRLKGDCISLPSSAVYRDLVPFGAAYQNITGDLSVSREGALAYISGGHCETDETLLGSPFPLDAAMHMACVWGQRFAGVVTFPVGFEKRIIYQKTKQGEEYLGRIVPAGISTKSFIVDAWIYQEDIICEFIRGIKMMDVTAGRMSAPEWIKDKG